MTNFTNYPGAGDLFASQGFQQAVRVGNTVYISGQGGWDETGSVPADVELQVNLLVDNLEACLVAAGVKGGMKDAFKILVFVTDFKAFALPLMARFRGIYGNKIPPMTVVGVNKLAYENMGIEVEVIAGV